MQLSHLTTYSSSNTMTPMNGSAATSPKRNGSPNNYPLPPPDSLLAGVKQPGLTRGALQQLAAVPLSNASSSSLDHKKQLSMPQSPIHSPSPSATSPTDSSWEGASAPPSRPPSRPSSQPASRAPSMSAGVSGGKLALPPPAFVPASRERRASKGSDVPFVTPGKKPGSVHSDKAEGGHKFNLKDLLASGPKLNRKSSQRSTSSKRSDSDAGDGRARSTAGDSAVSLTQKYGVCQKLAIGKGATSVVRLAHKWDRSEEKLYAIKVSVHLCSILLHVFLSPSLFLPDAVLSRNSVNAARMNRKRSTSRSSPQSSAFRPRCTTPTSWKRLTSFKMRISIGAKWWSSALEETYTPLSRKGKYIFSFLILCVSFGILFPVFGVGRCGAEKDFFFSRVFTHASYIFPNLSSFPACLSLLHPVTIGWWWFCLHADISYFRLETRADYAFPCSGMSPSEVECCFKQILNGVSYLHSQGVAHRDIKPENLFFDTKGHLKVLCLANMVVCWYGWRNSVLVDRWLWGLDSVSSAMGSDGAHVHRTLRERALHCSGAVFE